ncbi:pyrroloquinoline quinone biosynthesis protein PqqB [Aquamicrobium zhengzhouense]|uniref:Coenzyme PQQ synthesis protein B n=1 Tax=Aquamicrobium zhengzhouense TaxID=2781738 RepID=A0ABS0SDC4_9HYPH|nr:pyrroloquinoline quinone biosynthesis protein PqqB [Aquamicrobium zhengzhouense]MBI1621304.1 pyrroloquinoline quinone biosynthesis protein PqqB [Aquamicrobium zhengzhouense]
MRAVVLGAAAGGGFPQWNCGCRNCCAVRQKLPGFVPRSQSSIAVTGDGRHWAILNASPDIRDQINQTPALHPTGLRESPISSVLVTNGDLDHVAGLLILREKQPFRLHLTAGIASILDENPIFRVLDPQFVERRSVQVNEEFELAQGLRAVMFPVPGKVPLYAEDGEVATDVEGEQTVGVELKSDSGTMFYIPGCAKMTPALAERVRGASLVFFDGSFWSQDELKENGVGTKTSARMGHMVIGGPDGSLEAFRDLDVKRKIYVHINNTNPILDPASGAFRAVNEAGWEVAVDQMEVRL